MWKIGKIPDNIIDEEYKHIDYITEPFNDQTMIDEWTKLYGNIHDTGDMADFRHRQPTWTQDIINFLNLSLAGSSFYRMGPGKILPYHSDTYLKYIEHYKITDKSKIHRAIIFLEDWMPGHVFEVDGHPVYNYTKGTYVLWQNSTPHLAANIGPHNRYTLQITGILD